MKPLHDIPSAARLLSVSPWSLRCWIKRGKLRPVRLGRRVLLEEAELERFITAAKANGGKTQDLGEDEWTGREKAGVFLLAVALVPL